MDDDKKNDGRIYLTCRTCTREFYLAQKEIEFYKLRNYALPASCYGCRQFKKKLAELDKDK